MPYFAFVSTNAVLVRKNDRKVSKNEGAIMTAPFGLISLLYFANTP